MHCCLYYSNLKITDQLIKLAVTQSLAQVVIAISLNTS